MNDFMRRKEEEDALQYGTPRHSGRYPWGSGGDEYQRSIDFYGMIEDLKDAFRRAFGFEAPEKEIAESMGLTIAEFRAQKTINKEAMVQGQTQRAVTLREKGVSINEIAADLGIPPPTVRLRLKNSESRKQSSLKATMSVVKDAVDKHQLVDIGKGTELNVDTGIKMGISPEKLRAAVSALRLEGYVTYNLPAPQVGTKQFTNTLVIAPPGTTYGQAMKMLPQIHTIGAWSEDDGQTYLQAKEPLSVNPKRVSVKYSSLEDGVVYVRPGVSDLDMGKNSYAQVRIKVGDGHYIKGMAIHKADLPDGVDLEVHTNKKAGTPMLGDKNNSVLKPLSDDPDLPFGSIIKRQIIKGEKVVSALNLVNEEGDWDLWNKSLPSQMLAKQPHSFIKSHLNDTRDQLRDRLDEINSITNPVVKKHALEKFAEKVESDAVDLRAAQMPKQRTQVILPLTKIAKTEIYAPNFETGEKVVLIRYPHGGRFEIPEVTVNNNNRAAKKLLGNASDAIGIHPSVAERLSGADFDGDTVVVIPNRSGKIKGASTASKVFDDQLKNFNPKDLYGGYEEKDGKGTYKLMTQTGLEMGKITNLITDMSIQGAKPEHIVRAVKHSMVVIDAEKHKLNYKESERQNNIKQLVELYQSHPETGKKPGGASTLLSQSTAKVKIPERRVARVGEGGPLDEQGRVVRVPTGKMRTVYDKKTKTWTDEKVPILEEVKRGRLVDDAYDLVRDKSDPVERLYADHANEMKALSNAARLQAYRTPNPPMNKQAKQVYAPEVDKLLSDLKRAEAQKPLDRRAQVYANSVVKAKKQEDATLYSDTDRRKKVERSALAASRARLGLEKPVIEISDRQWDAIQSGAISASKLKDILGYADDKRVMELAMPRTNAVMTNAISARASAMLAAGKSSADVAAALGISVSTLKTAISRGDV